MGIKLMNLDAKITEAIIQAFTDKGIPVLTVHDSYIVRWGWEKELEATMRSAFKQVMGVELDRENVRRAITYETDNDCAGSLGFDLEDKDCSEVSLDWAYNEFDLDDIYRYEDSHIYSLNNR